MKRRLALLLFTLSLLLSSCAESEPPAPVPPIQETMPQEPAEQSDRSATAAAMADISATDLPSRSYGLADGRQLADALNHAADFEMTESFLASGKTLINYWWIWDIALPGSDDTLTVSCGLEENIVKVRHDQGLQQQTAYFDDEMLYQLVRQAHDRKEYIDEAALAVFQDELTAQMEQTLSDWQWNPANFHSYQLLSLEKIWEYENEQDGSRVELYEWDFALLSDTPETTALAGGVWFDSQMRLHGFNCGSQFAAKYSGETLLVTAFMANDFQYDPQNTVDRNWAIDRINDALDQAQSAQ